MSPVERLEGIIEAAEVRTAGDELRDVARFGLLAPRKGDVPPKAARIIVKPAAAVDGCEADRA